MRRLNPKGHRAASAIVLLVGGGAVAATTWVGGSGDWAIVACAIYTCLAVIAYLWAGRSGDIAAIMRAGGDERQRGLDRDATAITGLVVIVVAIVGAIIALGRTGNPGDFGVLCAVAGITYGLSLTLLRRRR